MTDITQYGIKAREASYKIASMSTEEKNRVLSLIADRLVENTSFILEQNSIDLTAAKEAGMVSSMQDRLLLTPERIAQMAEGVRDIASLPDPVGEVVDFYSHENGMKISKMRVPLGVVAIIYEARPNVTSDAAVICLKSGNAVILKGGKEAIHSNLAIAEVMRSAISDAGFCPDIIQIIRETDREATNALMKLNGYVDILIPRGGAGLIKAVVQNSTVPVIETGAGNCHIYIDSDCDDDMAVNIVYNAKTSRVSVCNAAESLVIHRDKLYLLDRIYDSLRAKNVTLYCDAPSSEKLGGKPGVEPASEQDFYTEYNDYKMSVKTVSSLDEAISHINSHSTKHSECIVTRNPENAEKFLKQVDSAAVYHNASTRFTDGGVFGLGAEIGISTQKTHARGPMGLREMTIEKFIIHGDGQVR